MSRIELDISDELNRKAQQRATESGFANVNDYLQSLLQSDAEGIDFGPPAGAQIANDEELEQVLLARDSTGPSIEATPEFWRDLNNQFKSMRAGRGSK